MPIKITRRPYTDCPWQWSLTIDGVSGGNGGASDYVCNSLNGTFALDFKSCVSTANLLVWEYACRSYDIETTPCFLGSCASSFIASALPWSGADPDIPPGIEYTVGKPFEEILRWSSTTYESSGCCLWVDSKDYLFTVQDKGDLPFVPDDNRYWTDNGNGTFSALVSYIAMLQPYQCDGCTDYFVITKNVNSLSIGDSKYVTVEVRYDTSPFDCISNHTYDLETYVDTGDPFIDGVVLCGQNGLPQDNPFSWTSQVSVTITDVVTGVDTKNSRFKSDWHLEYNISESKWLLRSFAVVGYPQYELHDELPCEGDEKVLTLIDPDGDSGCTNSPPTVTITRVCPPDVEETAFPRKLNKRTGKSHRLCGCDCQDQVVDLRWKCEENCESTASAGCETWSENQIECKYPASSDACTYCEEDKAPCAYEAMFECDIEHEGVSIAAKVVTLRHKCYFEKGKECDWVAIGPSANEDDGPVGKEPVCATCADECLSGCSWDAWQTARCPASGGGECGELTCQTDATFTVAIGEIRGVSNEVVIVSDTVTLSLTSHAEWSGIGTGGVRVTTILAPNCEMLRLSVAYIAGLDAGYYLVSGSPINCDADIVFRFDSTNNSGSSWPDSVTLVKN